MSRSSRVHHLDQPLRLVQLDYGHPAVASAGKHRQLPYPQHTEPAETFHTCAAGPPKHFTLVIVDTPSACSGPTAAPLDARGDAWFVITCDPASIRAAVGTVRALRQLCK